MNGVFYYIYSFLHFLIWITLQSAVHYINKCSGDEFVIQQYWTKCPPVNVNLPLKNYSSLQNYFMDDIKSENIKYPTRLKCPLNIRVPLFKNTLKWIRTRKLFTELVILKKQCRPNRNQCHKHEETVTNQLVIFNMHNTNIITNINEINNAWQNTWWHSYYMKRYIKHPTNHGKCCEREQFVRLIHPVEFGKIRWQVERSNANVTERNFWWKSG